MNKTIPVLAMVFLLPAIAPASDAERLARIEAKLAAISHSTDAAKLEPGSREFGKAAVETIFYDGFEGATLNAAWGLFIDTGYTQAAWAPTTFTAYAGNRSAFCAGQGSAAVVPGAQAYPPNMSTSMVYGPFSLSNATASQMDFAVVGNTEPFFDVFDILITDDEFETYQIYSMSGFTFSTWAGYFVDFSSLPMIGNINGSPEVYIAFRFSSDEALGYEGVFIDEVLIRKDTGSNPTPTPTPPPPTPTPTPTPPPPTPTPTPTPPPGGISKPFTIFNDGTGVLQIQGIAKEQNSGWLSIHPSAPFAVPAGQNREITVTVNPNGLAAGVYRDRLVVTSNDTSRNPYPDGITILYSVGTPNTTGRLLGMTGAVGFDKNSDAIFDAADVER